MLIVFAVEADFINKNRTCTRPEQLLSNVTINFFPTVNARECVPDANTSCINGTVLLFAELSSRLSAPVITPRMSFTPN